MRSVRTLSWLDVTLITGCGMSVCTVAGCGQTVVLGSECPTEPGTCVPSAIGLDASIPVRDASVILPLDGELPSDALSSQDSDLAAALDAAGASTDATVAADSGLDAVVDSGSLALFPSISNGSFELTRGGTGDIAFQPPGSPALGLTLIEPWQACRAGLQVLATYPSETGPAVTAHEGNNFVLDQFAFGNPAGLSQQLGEPLRRGVPYAFAISLRVARESEPASLNVYGVSVQCLVNAVPLATSRVVSETTWQRVCIRFTPSFDQTAIMLGASSNATARLLMDDLRYDPECAAP